VALMRLRWWPALPPPGTCPTRFASSVHPLRNTLRSPKNHSSREWPKQEYKRRLHADCLVLLQRAKQSLGTTSSCVWFERAGCWGPPSRWSGTARLYRGMSLAQTPPGLPPTKAIVMAGLACRGQPAGVCLASQGPRTRSAAAPASGTCLVHVWSICHRSRAVRSGLQRSPAARRSPRSKVHPGETSLWAEP
jgi:hypothetical protein